MEYTPPAQFLIRRSFERYISLCLLATGLIILVRFYEIFIISGSAGYPSGSIIELIGGIRFDLLLAFRLSLFFLIPFLFIDHYSPKAARIFFAAVSVVVIMTDIALLRYFSATRIPLGSDILGYSFSEIQQTVGASGEINLTAILTIVLFLIFAVYVFYRWHDLVVSITLTGIFALFMFISLLPVFNFNPDPAEYRNEFIMNIAANKFNFFTESLLRHYLPETGSANFVLNTNDSGKSEIVSGAIEPTPAPPINKPVSNADQPSNAVVKPNQQTGGITNNPGSTVPTPASGTKSNPILGNPFIFISEDYPFLHEEKTPDLLMPFFKPGEKAPSFVFIVVESLGRAYSGNDAYLGSFTPFLDSLMRESLYWENCLSTSGRTFSVMPSLLASLPFGEKGFADLKDKMPDHLSMISLLKRNAGYTSSFYYGGDPKFDDMGPFMKRQGTTRIVGFKDFGKDYTQLPSNSGGFTWGYGDREIFRKYLTDLKSNETDKRIDVILTLAMHSPFKVPDQEYYNQLFEKRMNEISLSEKDMEYNRQYTAQFASILYFDEALKYFFAEFSKLESFNNTIFVITGDHRMPEIPISTQLDRFHVPLVIYSPLLNNGKMFSSVVTHFDVVPSLLSLLKNRLNISLPTVSSWIGHGLDTNISFRNLYSYPLMRNTTQLMDWVSGDHFLSGSTLYRIYPSMDIEPVNNTELRDQLQKDFVNYKAKNNFATKDNRVIPDSLKRYIQQ